MPAAGSRIGSSGITIVDSGASTKSANSSHAICARVGSLGAASRIHAGIRCSSLRFEAAV